MVGQGAESVWAGLLRSCDPSERAEESRCVWGGGQSLGLREMTQRREGFLNSSGAESQEPGLSVSAGKGGGCLSEELLTAGSALLDPPLGH